MRRGVLAAIGLCAGLQVAGPVTLSAQGRLNFGVQFPFGVEESRSPLTWRMFSEPGEFQFRLSLSNDSLEAIRFDQSVPRVASVLRVNQGDEIPVSVDVTVRDVVSEPVSPSAAQQIEPHAMATWTVIVTRMDRSPFTAGLYRIVLTIDGVRVNGIGQWAILVQPGSTPAERAMEHVLVAREEMRLRNYESAFDAYRRAVAADDNDDMALIEMADTYLALSRYGEAIPLYEAAAVRAREIRDPLAINVAQAYVGVGDLSKAIGVLQSTGRSVDEVAEQIERMRRHAAENTPR